MKPFGRRDIYLHGQATCCSIMMITAILGTVDRESQGAQWGIGALLIIFTFVYDISIGPVCYSLVAEIGSTRLRSKTVVLARNLCGFRITLHVRCAHHCRQLGWSRRRYPQPIHAQYYCCKCLSAFPVARFGTATNGQWNWGPKSGYLWFGTGMLGLVWVSPRYLPEEYHLKSFRATSVFLSPRDDLTESLTSSSRRKCRHASSRVQKWTNSRRLSALQPQEERVWFIRFRKQLAEGRGGWRCQTG
jgi:hypothetical protein